MGASFCGYCSFSQRETRKIFKAHASRLGLGRESIFMLRAVTTTKSVASVGRSRIFRMATLHPLTSFDRCLCLGLGEEDPTRFMHKSMYPQRERVRASPLPPLCPASHVHRLYLLSALRPMCSLLFPDAYVLSGDFPMTTTFADPVLFCQRSA